MPDTGADGTRATSRVGFVGVGRMGAPMARCVAAAGLPLAIYDIRADAAEALARETGATACRDLAELASRSDLIVTMLPDGEAVRRVVAMELDGTGDGSALIASLRPGMLVVDMSTCAPGETRALGAALASREVGLVDAPVSGGVSRAIAGTLAILAGGADTDLARCAELFNAIGDVVVHVGPLGTGHAVKALNNAVSAAGLLASLEALLVAERFGVQPSVMVAALNSSTGRNNATENKLRQFVLSRTFSSGFELELLRKDLRIATTMARDTDTPAALTDRSLEIVEQAAEALEPGADHTAVARWLEQTAVIELEPAPATVEELAQ